MNAFRCVACGEIPRLSEKGCLSLIATSIHKSSYFGPWQRGVKIKDKSHQTKTHTKPKNKAAGKNEARFVFLEGRAAA